MITLMFVYVREFGYAAVHCSRCRLTAAINRSSPWRRARILIDRCEGVISYAYDEGLKHQGMKAGEG